MDAQETVRAAWRAWERRDVPASLAALDPEVELVPDPSWPEPGVVHGDTVLMRRATFTVRDGKIARIEYAFEDGGAP